MTPKHQPRTRGSEPANLDPRGKGHDMNAPNTINRRSFLGSTAALVAGGGLVATVAKSEDGPSYEAPDDTFEHTSILECHVRLSKADAMFCLELVYTTNDLALWLMDKMGYWFIPEWTAKLIYVRWSPDVRQGERASVRLRYHIRSSWEKLLYAGNGDLLGVLIPRRRCEHSLILRPSNLVSVRMFPTRLSPGPSVDKTDDANRPESWTIGCGNGRKKCT